MQNLNRQYNVPTLKVGNIILWSQMINKVYISFLVLGNSFDHVCQLVYIELL